MKRIFTIAVAATTLAGLGACSSDNKSTANNVTLPAGVTLPDGVTIPDITIPDISIPDISIPDISLPSDLSLPANLSSDCVAVAVQFAALYTQVFVPGAGGDLDKVFGDIEAKIPEDLRDDLEVMAAAFSEYAKVVKEHNNDMTNPEVQAAAEALDSPEVSAANDNLQAYFEETCPSG